MSNMANAARELQHPSARIPMTADATVIEFAKPRLLAVTSLTTAAAPAYTVTARVLHWVTALVITLMIPLGVIIGNDWGGRLQNSLYGLHESLGALLIPLILARLGYRLTNPPLPLPQDIPALQRAGWTAGGGAEYGFAPGWSLKAEYLHIDLGTSGCTISDCSAFSAAFAPFRTEIVRAGLNYRFNWIEPVMARF
jgi:opacity protein-like surface antigen